MLSAHKSAPGLTCCAPLCRRFGNVTSCDIIRDFKTGDSLCYGFIGYDNDAACEAAYFKMNNVLIDDRCAALLVGLRYAAREHVCLWLYALVGNLSASFYFVLTVQSRKM